MIAAELRAFGAFILAQLAGADLPPGVMTNPEAAGDIADDAARLKAARDYWLKEFQKLAPGTNAAVVLDAPWFTFMQGAAAIGPAPFEGLRELIRPADGFGSAGDLVVSELDAMASTDELARELKRVYPDAPSDYREPDLTDEIAKFLEIPDPVKIEDNLTRPRVRAIYACRELLNFALRFDFAAKALSQIPDQQLEFTELLALHRWEGAFAVPPADGSFGFGPVIQAEFGRTGARTASTMISKTDPKGKVQIRLTRPFYFNTVSSAAAMSDREAKIVAKQCSMLGDVGLDNLVTWELLAKDECRQVSEAAAQGGSLRSAIEGLLGVPPDGKATKALIPILHGLFMSLAELQLRRRSATEIANDVATRLKDLWVESLTNAANKNIVCWEPPTFAAARARVTTGFEWYASRSRPWTLVAVRDRTPAMRTMPRFTPFVTYLRYHAGDVVFMGVLLRLLRDLPRLKTAWAADSNDDWRTAMNAEGIDLATALPAGFSSWSSAELKQLNDDLRVWIDDAYYDVVNGVDLDGDHKPDLIGEAVWRHIGLIGSFTSVSPEPWLPAAAPADPQIKKVDLLAGVAKRTVELIQTKGLQRAIEVALEFARYQDLFAPGSALAGSAGFAGVKEPQLLFAKAESFIRFQKFFAAAASAASLDRTGKPH
jgi:hypothetical protein